MSVPEAPHWDVAAYALGVLDHREIPRFEAHLSGCRRCAVELELLVPASRILADVDPDDVRDAADHQLADRLIDAVRAERRLARRRRGLAAATGVGMAAAVAALALFTGASWLGAPTSPAGGPAPTFPVTAPGIGGPDLASGERFSGTDPDTGVHADVLLETADWGTRVSLALSSLAGPRECELLVVTTDGTAEVAATWRVPADGYGTAEQPAPLLLQAATAVARPDIDRVQVRAVRPDGGSALVTVPV